MTNDIDEVQSDLTILEAAHLCMMNISKKYYPYLYFRDLDQVQVISHLRKYLQKLKGENAETADPHADAKKLVKIWGKWKDTNQSMCPVTENLLSYVRHLEQEAKKNNG